MKQEQLIEYILLRQSGELSTEQSAELQQMLDTNVEAAKLAKEYDNIYQTACEVTDTPTVSELSFERILREGSNHLEETTEMKAPSRTWLAIAAAIAIAITGVVWQTSQQRTKQPVIVQNEPAQTIDEAVMELALIPEAVDEELEYLEEEMNYLNEELFSDDFWGDDLFAEGNGESDIDAIASELLALEERI